MCESASLLGGTVGSRANLCEAQVAMAGGVTMELHQLRSFVTVASAGSVSEAARQLRLAQPAVSQHIQSLEKELQVVLFLRGSRGMTLTDDGVALLGHARGLLSRLSELRAAAERLVGRSQSRVEMAATPSMAAYLLPPALRILGLSDPGLRLVVHERPTMDSLSLLATRSVDFAVVRDCLGNGFELEPLFDDPLVIAVGRRHTLASAERLELKDLARCSFVFFRHSGRELLYQAAILACAAAGYEPRVLCEGVEVTAMGVLVRSGAAVAIAPTSIVSLWGEEKVRVLSLPEPRSVSTVYLATMTGVVLSSPAQRVVRAIRRAAADPASGGDAPTVSTPPLALGVLPHQVVDGSPTHRRLA